MIIKFHWRTVLFAIFVLAFLISAPAVVLYTAGYRYQFGYNKIVQTGILNISSFPHGANIYIDGNEQSKRTPAIIDNVMPGNHEVRIQKSGYSSWQKNLVVNSKQSTFAKDVILFLEQESERYDGALIKDYESEMQNLVQTKSGFKIENLSDRTVLSTYDEKGIATIIVYLPLEKYAFASAPDPYILLFDNTHKLIVLVDPTQTKNPILLNAPANQWSWSDSKDALLYSDGFEVSAYSPISHKTEVITRVSEPISGLKWYDKGHVAVFSSKQGVEAIELDRRSQRNKTTLVQESNVKEFWFENDGEWIVWTSDKVGYRKRLQR